MVSEGRGLLGQGSVAGGMPEASALSASANVTMNDGKKENMITRRHVEVDIRTLLGSGTPAILRGKSRLGTRSGERRLKAERIGDMRCVREGGPIATL